MAQNKKNMIDQKVRTNSSKKYLDVVKLRIHAQKRLNVRSTHANIGQQQRKKQLFAAPPSHLRSAEGAGSGDAMFAASSSANFDADAFWEFREENVVIVDLVVADVADDESGDFSSSSCAAA